MDERRRVLWLVKGLGPGGAERLLVSFAQASTAPDLTYETAYLRTDRSHLVPDLEAAGVMVHPLPRPWWPLQLRRLIRSRRIAVVHAHSPLVAAVARIVVRTLRRRERPSLLSTEHNVPDAYHPLTKLANDLTYGLDDRHLAVSHGAKRSAPARHRDDVEVIVHGVSLEDVRGAADRSSARAELGLAPDDVVVGTIANYRVQKAWPDLLAAARLVLDKEPRVRFIGVGQGPLEREVEAEHRRLGLGHRFLLLGHRPDAVRVMSGCDLFCLASVQEGLPVALMEALALGLPVVATSVGGIPEAVTDGQEGRLVPAGDPSLLAAALIDVATDEAKRARMAVAAELRGEHFDIRRAVRRTEELYRAVGPAR